MDDVLEEVMGSRLIRPAAVKARALACRIGLPLMRQEANFC